MVLNISQFIAHLHPVLVHLPIGILLLACLFLWQSRKDRFEHLQGAINPMLFWGMISAVASCITGYVLSKTGDYDKEQVSLHMWMGIAVAVISLITYLARASRTLVKFQWLLASVLLLLVFITGHLGGSLTHGSDYLSAALLSDSGSDSLPAVKKKFIPDVQEAVVYSDLIVPLLQTKCYRCHSALRQKGKLRLDDSSFLMKGGKDGPAIVPFHAAQSELIKRVSLPLEDEHHMAPKDRPQLTENEKSLLNWWVDNGAGFRIKCRDIKQDGRIKTMLLSFQTNESSGGLNPSIPDDAVAQASEETTAKLRERGIIIMPVSQSSHYLEANFVSATKLGDSSTELLKPLQKQLIWLNLAHTGVTDVALKQLQFFPQLIRINLSNTKISDRGLEFLDSLHNLQYLNLVGDSVTDKGLRSLVHLKKLKSLYLYHTSVDKRQWKELQQLFPGTVLDSGGYNVPFNATDTVVVKAPVMN